MINDISERMQAEEAWRESEERVRALLNASTESVFLINNKGIILALKETVAQRLGKSVDELIGMNDYDLLPAKISKQRKRRVDKVIRSRKPLCFEDERDGRAVDHSVYPIFDKRGRVVKLAIYGRDITRQAASGGTKKLIAGRRTKASSSLTQGARFAIWKDMRHRHTNNDHIRQITVFGAGNAGIAEASRIKFQFPGIKVILYNRIKDEKSREKLALLERHRVFHLTGIYEGKVKPDVITSRIDEAVKGSRLILITTTANAHGAVASQMAPHLSDGQILLMFAGGIDSKFVMAKEIKEAGCEADLTFADTDTFIYATKIRELSLGKIEIWVKARKEKLYLSVLPSERMSQTLHLLEHSLYPNQFIGCDDPLQAGINDGPGLHIIGIIMHRRKIEAQEDFNFYLGLTQEMTAMIEELDTERIAVANAMGISDCPTTRDFLHTAYDIPLTDGGRERTLFDMVHDKDTPYYNPQEGPIRSPAPKSMNHRYLYEEVMTRVVPLYYMAKALRIDTPLHKRLIEEAGKILSRDYFKEGRSLDDLGLSPQDIQNWQTARKRFVHSF